MEVVASGSVTNLASTIDHPKYPFKLNYTQNISVPILTFPIAGYVFGPYLLGINLISL